MAIDLGEVTGSTASREKKKETTQIANGLDKDAFMKLFLEQLKNQDPTSPMETDKIITQTAQLTQVEMQEENKKTMKEVAEAMKASQDTNKSLQEFQKEMKKSLEILNMGMEENTNATTQGARANTLNAVSMIGKIAETDIMGLNVSGSGENRFSLYFDNKIDVSRGNPVIEILSPNNEIVRTISLNDKNGQQGYIDFQWDGKDLKGNIVEPASYQVRAHYNLNPETNQYDETRIGRGEVQSIIYDKGVPLMRLGDNIVPVQSALEFYPRGESGHKSVESIKAEANRAMNAYGEDFQTESLGDKYEKILQDREAKLAAQVEAEKDEDTLKAEAQESERLAKATEMKKYEKMLDSAEKGKQLEQDQLNQLDKKSDEAKFKKDSLESLLQAQENNKNVKPIAATEQNIVGDSNSQKDLDMTQIMQNTQDFDAEQNPFTSAFAQGITNENGRDVNISVN
ncbi:flagellar hook assembly protein FlgD [Helicobacter didelphidarum]|uniref:flagellar hook assembly protein FlgD n=1 Tax=Helicobacter didelphidarum TaxID=2040648 RepID=UPI0026D54BB5